MKNGAVDKSQRTVCFQVYGTGRLSSLTVTLYGAYTKEKTGLVRGSLAHGSHHQVLAARFSAGQGPVRYGLKLGSLGLQISRPRYLGEPGQATRVTFQHG